MKSLSKEYMLLNHEFGEWILENRIRRYSFSRMKDIYRVYNGFIHIPTINATYMGALLKEVESDMVDAILEKGFGSEHDKV